MPDAGHQRNRRAVQHADHAFAECGRKLGGGLHSAYLYKRAAARGAPPVPEIKLELYALLQDADVLLHVVDAGSRDLDGQIQAVEKTLSDLDLNHIPRLLVLNKIDRVQANDVEALRKRYQATAISALRPETFGPLIECLERSLNYQKAQDGGMDSNPVKRPIAVLENAAGS